MAATTPVPAPVTTPVPVVTPDPVPVPAPIATTDPVPVTNPSPVPDPVPSTDPVAGKNVLFVSDGVHNAFAAFDALAPATTGTVTGKVLTSTIDGDGRSAVDAARNLLYVTANRSIAVFSNASDLTGQIVPSRTFKPIISTGAYLGRIIFDSANDRMYVGYGTGPNIPPASGFAVFDHVSTLAGDVTPTRVFYSAIDISNFAMDLKRGLLYSKTTQQQFQEIFVFEHIDTASGNLPIARRIKLDGNVAALGIDSERDILYAGIEDKGLTALPNASTVSSYPTVLTLPITSISVPTNTGLLVADPRNDRLYISFDTTPVGSRAYILNHASTLGQSGHEPILSLTVAATSVWISAFSFF